MSPVHAYALLISPVLECRRWRCDVDIAIVVLVIVLFGGTLWMVDAVDRLGGGRTS
jgi:hypothetical protein